MAKNISDRGLSGLEESLRRGVEGGFDFLSAPYTQDELNRFGPKEVVPEPPPLSPFEQELALQQQLSVPEEEIAQRQATDPLMQTSQMMADMAKNFPAIAEAGQQMTFRPPETPQIAQAATGVDFDTLTEAERAKAFATLTRAQEEGLSVTEAEKSLELKGTPGGRIVTSVISGAAGIGSGLAGMADAIGIQGAGKVADNIDGWISEIAPINPNFVEKLGSGVGSSLVFIPFGFGVGSLAKAVGTISPKAASWFSASASAFLEAATEAGSVFNNTQSTGAATKSFLANVLLIGVTNKFGIFDEKLKKELSRGLLNSSLEGLQEAGQTIIEAGVTGKEVDWGEVVESAGIGAIIGQAVPSAGSKGEVVAAPIAEKAAEAPISEIEAGQAAFEERLKPQPEGKEIKLEEAPTVEKPVEAKEEKITREDIETKALTEKISKRITTLKDAKDKAVKAAAKEDQKGVAAIFDAAIAEVSETKKAEKVKEVAKGAAKGEQIRQEFARELAEPEAPTEQSQLEQAIAEREAAPTIEEAKRLDSTEIDNLIQKTKTRLQKLKKQKFAEERTEKKRQQEIAAADSFIAEVEEFATTEEAKADIIETKAEKQEFVFKKLKEVDEKLRKKLKEPKADELFNEIFDLKNERRDLPKGQTGRKASLLSQINKKVEELNEFARDLNVEFDKGRVRVAGVTIARAGKSGKISKAKLAKTQIASKKAQKPFSEIGIEEADRQKTALNFVTPDMLPTGIGDEVLEKGRNDILFDNEQTKEAQIVRAAAVNFLSELEKGDVDLKEGRVTKDEFEVLLEDFQELEARRTAEITAEDITFEPFSGVETPPVEPQLKQDNIVSDEALKKAERDIAKGIKPGAGIDPTLFKSYVIYTTGKIERGLKKFSDFAKHMIDKFGSGIRSSLREIWDKALQQIGFKESQNRVPLSREQDDNYRYPKNRGWKSMRETYKQRMETPLEANDETLRRFLRRKLLDTHSRSREIIKGVENIKNTKVEDGENFAVNSDLYQTRAAHRIEQIDKWLGKGKDNFLKKMAQAGVSLEDFGWYLYAIHTPVRNARIEAIQRSETKSGKERVRTPKEEDILKTGSGISNEEARAELKRLGSKKIEKMQELEKDFRENIIDKSLKAQFDAGLISKEEYDKWSKDKTYVPLKGKDDVGANYDLGKGTSTTNRGIRRAKGRKSLPNNPFLQAIEDYENAVVRSEKNRVGQSVLDFVIANPNEDMYRIVKPKVDEIKNSTGEKSYQLPEDSMPKAQADRVYRVWRGGKAVDIVIEDKALLDGLKGFGVKEGWKVFRAYNNFRRSFITERNIFFGAINFIRDFAMANIALSAEQKKGTAKAVSKNVPKAIAGMYQFARDRKPTEWSEAAERFSAAGGPTGFVDKFNLVEKEKKFQKSLDKLSKKGADQRGWLRSVDEYVKDVNFAIENGVRLATFVELQKQGMSEQQAASEAKNLTVNFNKKGDWGAAINAMWLFSNASMQGSYRVFQVLRTKKGKKIASGLIAASVLQNIFNQMVNPDEWDEVPDHEKDSNWIIMLPNGGRIKIPLAYGFNIFPTLGSAATDLATGKDNIPEFMARTFGSVMASFNPLGSSDSFVHSVTPTLFQPVVELWGNTTYSGNPIRKKNYNPSKEGVDSELHFSTINPYVHDLTRWMNRLDGGNANRTSRLDINPEDIEHVVETVGAGLPRELYNLVTTGAALFDDDTDATLRKVPLARRFFAQPDEKRDLRIVYEVLRRGSNRFLEEKEKTRFFKAILGAVQNETLPTDRARALVKQFNNSQAGTYEVETIELDIKELKTELIQAGNTGDSDRVKDIIKEIEILKIQLIKAKEEKK